MKRVLKFSIKVALGSAIAMSVVTSGLMFCVIMLVAMIMTLGSDSKNGDKTQEVIYGNGDAKHHFVSIPINGMIVGDKSDVGEPLQFFSESMTYGEEVKKELRDLAKDKTVDGIILDINSPGGTIYGANAIADGVAYYEDKTNKPVISFVSGLAASGAYWAAVSGKTIVADTGTSVGSIGVVSGPFQYYDTVIAQDGGSFAGGVVTQKGIQTTFITAGTSKDFGNPYRKMTKTEIDSLQNMVNNAYDTFTSYVSKQRNIPKDVIVNTLGALVYDEKTALENKMIDTIGNREAAYEVLAKLTSISSDDYYVSKEHPKSGILMNLLSARSLLAPLQASHNLCGLTKVQLVYQGDVTALCK